MPSDSNDNMSFLVVKLKEHVYQHFENQLMLLAIRNDLKKTFLKASQEDANANIMPTTEKHVPCP